MVTDGKDQSIRINPEKLHKAVGEYGVGSIINVNDEALSVERWHEIIRAIQAEAKKSGYKSQCSTASIPFTAELRCWQHSFPAAAGDGGDIGIPNSCFGVVRLCCGDAQGRHTMVFFARCSTPEGSRCVALVGNLREDTYLATVMGSGHCRGYEGSRSFQASAVFLFP